MLWLWRRPLTVMLALDAEAVGGLLSGKSELTPRPRAARAVKLRFSVAIEVTCSPLISVLTSLDSACTWSASAVTETSVVSAPTVSFTASARVCETFSVRPFAVKPSKPLAAAFKV